ncbi:MAG: hypothetical protein LBF97_05305, partial [Elusimicrobiota bacterium]|nr:hypothetical protein [Elusimicrobiota bacterium]
MTSFNLNGKEWEKNQETLDALYVEGSEMAQDIYNILNKYFEGSIIGYYRSTYALLLAIRMHDEENTISDYMDIDCGMNSDSTFETTKVSMTANNEGFMIGGVDENNKFTISFNRKCYDRKLVETERILPEDSPWNSYTDEEKFLRFNSIAFEEDVLLFKEKFNDITSKRVKLFVGELCEIVEKYLQFNNEIEGASIMLVNEVLYILYSNNFIKFEYTEINLEDDEYIIERKRFLLPKEIIFDDSDNDNNNNNNNNQVKKRRKIIDAKEGTEEWFFLHDMAPGYVDLLLAPGEEFEYVTYADIRKEEQEKKKKINKEKRKNTKKLKNIETVSITSSSISSNNSSSNCSNSSSESTKPDIRIWIDIPDSNAVQDQFGNITGNSIINTNNQFPTNEKEFESFEKEIHPLQEKIIKEGEKINEKEYNKYMNSKFGLAKSNDESLKSLMTKTKRKSEGDITNSIKKKKKRIEKVIDLDDSESDSYVKSIKDPVEIIKDTNKIFNNLVIENSNFGGKPELNYPNLNVDERYKTSVFSFIQSMKILREKDENEQKQKQMEKEKEKEKQNEEEVKEKNMEIVPVNYFEKVMVEPFSPPKSISSIIPPDPISPDISTDTLLADIRNFLDSVRNEDE